MQESFLKISKLKVTSFIVMVGFTLSVLYHYIQAFYLRKEFYPFGTYLFKTNDVLHDFVGTWLVNSENDPFRNIVRGLGNNYPPFGNAITAIFTSMPVLEGLLAYVLTLLVCFGYFLWKTIPVKGDTQGWNWFFLATIGLMTYPFHFSIDRLNSEPFLALWAMGFLLCYWAGRPRLGAILLGGAAAAKIYPGLYGFVYLRERRFKEFAIMLGSMVLFTVAAMFLYRIDFSELMMTYKRSYEPFRSFVTSPGNDQHGCSLFSGFRVLQIMLIGGESAYSPYVTEISLSIYVKVSLAVLLVYLTGILSGGLQLWERLFLIVATIILVPQTSGDYKLFHLFVPFAAFLAADTDRKTGLRYAIYFGLLLIPKDYWHVYQDISIATLINPCVLIAGSWPILKKAFKAENLREIPTLIGLDV